MNPQLLFRALPAIALVILLMPQTGQAIDPFASSPTDYAQRDRQRPDGDHNFDHSHGIMMLPPGTIEKSVDLLRYCLEDMQGYLVARGGMNHVKWEISNIVYAGDSASAEFSATLRIKSVSPVDAIALIAIAAGCRMESIHSPEDIDLVIGYRIERVDDAADTGVDPVDSRPARNSPGTPVAALPVSGTDLKEEAITTVYPAKKLIESWKLERASRCRA